MAAKIVQITLAAVYILISACFALKLNPAPFKDCGSVHGKIVSVEVSVPVQSYIDLIRDNNVTFQVGFNTDETVNTATSKVYGIIDGIPVPFPLDNPDACKNSGLSCPLQSGQTYTFTSYIFVQKEYPKITLVVEWKMLDQNGQMIWCAAMPAQITDGFIPGSV